MILVWTLSGFLFLGQVQAQAVCHCADSAACSATNGKCPAGCEFPFGGDTSCLRRVAHFPRDAHWLDASRTSVTLTSITVCVLHYLAAETPKANDTLLEYKRADAAGWSDVPLRGELPDGNIHKRVFRLRNLPAGTEFYFRALPVEADGTRGWPTSRIESVYTKLPRFSWKRMSKLRSNHSSVTVRFEFTTEDATTVELQYSRDYAWTTYGVYAFSESSVELTLRDLPFNAPPVQVHFRATPVFGSGANKIRGKTVNLTSFGPQEVTDGSTSDAAATTVKVWVRKQTGNNISKISYAMAGRSDWTEVRNAGVDRAHFTVFSVTGLQPASFYYVRIYRSYTSGARPSFTDIPFSTRGLDHMYTTSTQSPPSISSSSSALSSSSSSSSLSSSSIVTTSSLSSSPSTSSLRGLPSSWSSQSSSKSKSSSSSSSIGTISSSSSSQISLSMTTSLTSTRPLSMTTSLTSTRPLSKVASSLATHWILAVFVGCCAVGLLLLLILAVLLCLCRKVAELKKQILQIKADRGNDNADGRFARDRKTPEVAAVSLRSDDGSQRPCSGGGRGGDGSDLYELLSWDICAPPPTAGRHVDERTYSVV